MNEPRLDTARIPRRFIEGSVNLVLIGGEAAWLLRERQKAAKVAEL